MKFKVGDIALHQAPYDIDPYRVKVLDINELQNSVKIINLHNGETFSPINYEQFCKYYNLDVQYMKKIQFDEEMKEIIND